LEIEYFLNVLLHAVTRGANRNIEEEMALSSLLSELSDNRYIMACNKKVKKYSSSKHRFGMKRMFILFLLDENSVK